MANDGYIKLYRKMMKWGWYTDTNTKCVFLHLLLLAQYEPCFFRGVHLEVGQAVTSVKKISAETNISVRSVRTAIEHLKSTSELTQSPMGKFSLFTLKNYADYQLPDKPADNQVTSNRQATDKQPTNTLILRNQEVKKSRNQEKKISPNGDTKENDLTEFSEPMQKTLTEWFAYKAERKESYRPMGRTKFLSSVKSKIAKFEECAVIEVFDLSMSNGWQGVIWDKLDTTKTVKPKPITVPPREKDFYELTAEEMFG